MNNVIIYEQPLNEHIRACLRLEHLFKQINDTSEHPTTWASRSALHSLLKVLNVIDRPDLKTKLSKALYQHASILTQFERSPQVDSEKLRGLLDELDEVIDKLYATSGRIGGTLYENDFLSNVRSHMQNPGGPCNFSIPSYQLWLNQPADKRTNDLKLWTTEFELLEKAVTLLLQLTRQFSKPETKTAIDGFFQQSLDSNSKGELVRVILDADKNLFPEISVGKHRLSLRFYEASINSKAKQTHQDVEFKLLFCAV